MATAAVAAVFREDGHNAIGEVHRLGLGEGNDLDGQGGLGAVGQSRDHLAGAIGQGPHASAWLDGRKPGGLHPPTGGMGGVGSIRVAEDELLGGVGALEDDLARVDAEPERKALGGMDMKRGRKEGDGRPPRRTTGHAQAHARLARLVGTLVLPIRGIHGFLLPRFGADDKAGLARWRMFCGREAGSGEREAGRGGWHLLG